MATLTPRSSIVIRSNRQRQTFDAQKEDDLRSSIETNGLLHAVVIREDAAELVLVAGETRIRQMDDIWALGGTFTYDGQPVPPGMVPTTNLGPVTELEAEDAELNENLKRADLTWQERADAEARLHSLRVKQSQQAIKVATLVAEAKIEKAKQSGEIPADAGSGDGFIDAIMSTIPKPHTIADTAEELFSRRDGGYQAQTKRSIILAKNLDNPVIAKAKTADEALKLLRKQEEQERNAQLAIAVGKTFTADVHTLRHGSCLEIMQEPAMQGKFDVILTDPPYGMGADSFGDGGGKLTNSEHHYDDSYESWVELMRQWCPLTMKVTKPEAHLYAFCDLDRFHELKAMLEAVGWDVFRTPFVIHKLNSGRVPRPEHGPRRQYELCLYALKGGKPVTCIRPDVIAAEADRNMTHGAQKPVAVYQDLLSRSVRPGDEALDCFSGSGTLLPAAHTLKCKATLIEQATEYYGMGLKRLGSLAALENNFVLPGMEG